MSKKSWLAAFLDAAAAENWCTDIYCTTCGATDFRIGLLQAASKAQGVANVIQTLKDLRQWDVTLAETTTIELARLPDALTQEHVRALQMIFLWSPLGEPRFEIVVGTRGDGVKGRQIDRQSVALGNQPTITQGTLVVILSAG